ncbi:MAG: condensation domain-containing protein, partial [Tumebacillaceae bacterium]
TASAVIVREEADGDKRLVAYLASEGEAATVISEVRRSLKSQLPDYMVPAAFVCLESLPRTRNGKVDRRNLPAPTDTKYTGAEQYTAPRNEIEERVVAIWEELLHVRPIGIYDNFFELGGHSLLATQVISRLRDALQVELTLRSIFENQSVADLAEQISASDRLEAGLRVPPIVQVARTGRLPLSFAQQRLYFFDQLEPNSPIYNVPMAVRLTGALHVDTLERSLNELVARHESLRTTFGEANGEPYQVVAPELSITLQQVDVETVSSTEREARLLALVSEEAWRPYDLTTGPLVRFTLYRLGEQEHVLLFNMHHIVFDGWSLGILYAELQALYEAFLQGNQSPLAPQPIQYADFSQWQRSYLRGAVMEKQLAYWRQQLGGTLPVLQLPTDPSLPANGASHGALQRFELPRALAESLVKLAEQEGATMYMVALAVFKALMYRYTGQTDLLVGSPIAGRNHGGIENVIGVFVNTLVLRTDLSGKPTFRELVQRVRETALDAYTHQDLPFERLVEELQPGRGAGHMPLFQVMFVHLADSALALPGLETSTYEYDHTIAKFDLTLTLIENDQGMVGNVEYRTDLFQEATITRMITHYRTLLEAVVADPTQAISDLPITTDVVELDDEELDELFS